MTTWNPDIDIVITDSEDEIEQEFKRDFKGREAMLFVVDVKMWSNQERFLNTLKIIRSAFLSGLLMDDKALLGIVFANTDMSPEPFEPRCLENILVPAHCAVFLPPRQLTKGIVEHYMRFLETVQLEFETQYGVAEHGASFAQMLRLCLNLFDNCGYALNNARIVYMTDKATPHEPQSHEYQMALQKAKDLEGRDIEFHVIPMLDEPFDYDLFYKEFMALAREIELDSFEPPDAQLLREILADRKLRQDFLKRCLGHFRFSLGPNLEIAAQYYNYFEKRIYPRKVKLLRRNNNIIKQRFKIVITNKDEGSQDFEQEHFIKTTDGWYEIKLGDMPIPITPEQVNRVRNLHAPGMLLLGFKPLSTLEEHVYYKPCNFMYPDDQSIIGSKRLFRALWQRCLERQKIAVCLFMRKRKSIPRYVALVPVQHQKPDVNEAKNSYCSLLTGDGFKIVYLPMAKHYRNVDLHDWNSMENATPPEGLELFRKIVKKLRIRYEPSLINDPALETLQADLLALAFNIVTENAGLSRMPNAEQQDERIDALIEQFENVFSSDPEKVAQKRAAATATAGNTAKVPKTTDEQLKDLEYVKRLSQNQTLGKCTIAQLQSILQEHFDVQLPKSANKTKLLEKLEELLN